MTSLQTTECKFCTKFMSFSSLITTSEGLVCKECDFWQSIIEHQKDPQAVVVDGRFYSIHPEDSEIPEEERGFGGQSFWIQFLQGEREKVWTTNLWCLGSIPTRFRDQLPDNAVFLKG